MTLARGFLPYGVRVGLLGDKIDQSEIDAMLSEARMSLAAELVSENKPVTEEKHTGTEEKRTGPVVEKVEFAPFKPQTKVYDGQKKELKFFSQIPLSVSGELGKAYLTVRELLKLEEGSVIKLDKLAGESATVLVNGQYLGSAEIVVINERFGLRVTAVGLPDHHDDKHQDDKQQDEKKETETQTEQEEAADSVEQESEDDGS
jgi:flagellar motor switch protein FliN/FliY